MQTKPYACCSLGMGYAGCQVNAFSDTFGAALTDANKNCFLHMRYVFTFRWLIWAALTGCCSGQATAQPAGLQSGFDAAEYADVLWLAFFGITDSLENVTAHTLRKGTYTRVLRSPETGLYNRCEVYVRSDSVIVLSLRGTVQKPESWLENFYAGMIPATGSIRLADDYTFEYKLANRTDALVHTGWTIGTGFLAKSYLPVLKELLSRGLRQILVTGHSQGGALSYLSTSFIYYHFKDTYPDMQLKTLASAAPKPGNLYYAYDIESVVGQGMLYRVVNAEDWVPESPISIQALGDFNRLNPLATAPEAIRKQKFPERVALKYMYDKMRKGSAKAAARYQKYLGRGVGKLVKKSLPGYVPPEYATGSNYMTAGAPIILMPDAAYHQAFPYDARNVFLHHLYPAYMWLLKRDFKL